MFVSDIVQLQELPAAVKNSLDAYVGCIAGASMKADYLAAIEDAGFQDVSIRSEKVFGMNPPETATAEPTLLIDGEKVSPESIGLNSDDVKGLGASMASIGVEAVKR